MQMGSTIGGNFLRADETTIVFWGPIGLEVLEAARSISTIIMVSHGWTTIVAHEEVFLIVATTEEFKGPRVRVITHGLKHHVVSLSDGQISNILHGLDEWQGASVGPLGLLLKMHSKSRFVIDVISTPKVHGNAPEDGELCKAAPDVRHIPEKLWASLFAEVTIAEHGWMGVVITNPGSFLLDCSIEVLTESLCAIVKWDRINKQWYKLANMYGLTLGVGSFLFYY